MENKKVTLRIEDLNKGWMKSQLRSINNIIGDGKSYRERDKMCWDMFYSEQKNSSYDYLTSYGDFDIPVTVRFTSIVKPNIDWLVSKYLGNPFNFSVRTVDKKSLEKKYQQKIDAYVETIIQGIEEQYANIDMSLQQLNQKMQELQMMVEQQPENQEHAMQIQQLQQQMPMIMLKINQLKNVLIRQQKRLGDKLNKADLLSKFKAKDIREDFIQRKMVSFYEENDLGNVHKATMTEKCVTDKPSIFVDIVNNKLVYKDIPATSHFFGKNSSIPEAENGTWEAIEEYWPYDKILSMYGNELTYDDVKLLNAYSPNNGTISNFEKYEDSSDHASSYVQSYKPTISDNNIRVLKVYFNATVEVEILKSKTSDGKYELTKLKKDNDIIRENQRVESRFKTYAFEGVIILGSIFVGMKMRDKQVLSVDNFGWNQLPVIADNFDDITRRPYSIIWVTKDLQALYQIIEYYEELLLVISGVKGFVMDMSQMPDGMDPKEWMYFRKLGTMYIESYKKERRQQTTFNQFQTYDDSIPASIQYLGMMKDRIQQRVDQITGVTRIARGEIESRDAVGNSKLSIQATNIIADVLFWEHDQIVRRALSRAMNLYAKFIGHKGESFSIFDKLSGDHDIVSVPEGLLDGADYDTYIMNNNKDIRDIQELKGLINAEYSRGAIDFVGMIKLFGTTSLTEMRLLAEQMAEQAAEMKAQQQNSQFEGQKQLLEFEYSLKEKLEAGTNQLKNVENQLKKLDLDLKDKKIIFDKELKEKEIASNNYLKMLEIMTKSEQETAWRNAERDSVKVDQLLKEIEILANFETTKEKNLIDDKKLNTRVEK
jgi:hypothetical protein